MVSSTVRLLAKELPGTSPVRAREADEFWMILSPERVPRVKTSIFLAAPRGKGRLAPARNPNALSADCEAHLKFAQKTGSVPF